MSTRTTPEERRAARARYPTRLVPLAEQDFDPERKELKSELSSAAQSSDLTSAQTAAIAALNQLMRADYGRGFRGMMLCQAEPALPSALHHRVEQFRRRFHAQLDEYRTRREAEFAKLRQQLAPLRAQHLGRSEFGELMAIDLRLDELRYALRPIWIFASRPPSAPQPESALLLDARDAQFRVRFRRDDFECWLSGTQVVLRPSDSVPLDELNVPHPDDAIGGSPLTESSRVVEEETLLCYRGNMWHPVKVVDVSPFGVVVHWDGLSSDQDRVEPRMRLRYGTQ